MQMGIRLGVLHGNPENDPTRRALLILHVDVCRGIGIPYLVMKL